MNGNYPKGNKELLDMLRNSSDETAIRNKLSEIGDLNQPILDERGDSTTYLFEAVEENNLVAVRTLLNHGADPNYFNEDLLDDCALWDLQYWDIENEDPNIKYQIAKEFFQHGADPNIIPYKGGESLYDYVWFKVIEDGVDKDWDYLLNFYKLLLAYGGGGIGYPRPHFSGEIDKDRIGDYKIEFVFCDDNYHIDGYVVDPEGKMIGKL